MQMVKYIANANENKYFIRFNLNPQKAFDTVDLRQLLGKLVKYGKRGVTYSWLESYLEKREQWAKMNIL